MGNKTSLNRLINNIVTDVRKTTKSALEYAGKRVSDDLGQMAYLALDHYYSTYDPIYYNRLYTKDGSLLNSYRKVNQRDGFGIKAGVIFEPDTMSHKHRGIPEEAIFENFLHGEHGYKYNPSIEDWEVISSGINYRNELDSYYNEYVDSRVPYNYFKEYMDAHLNH